MLTLGAAMLLFAVWLRNCKHVEELPADLGFPIYVCMCV